MQGAKIARSSTPPRLADALTNLKKAVAGTDSVNGDAWYMMGDVYGEMDSTGPMLTALGRAVTLNAGLAAKADQLRIKPFLARFHEGVEAFKRQDWSAAAKAFEASLAIRSDTTAILNADLAYHNLGDLAKAQRLAFLEKWAKEFPANYPIQMQYISALFDGTRIEPAVPILVEMHKSHPDSMSVTLALADAYTRLNRMSDAQPLYEIAEKRGADDIDVKRSLGDIYKKKEDWVKALKYYQDVVGMKGAEPDDIYVLAVAAAKVENWALANETADKYLAVPKLTNDQQKYAWNIKAVSLAHLGKIKEGNDAQKKYEALGGK